MVDNQLPVAELLPDRFWAKQEKYSDDRDGDSVASVGGTSHKAERMTIKSGVINGLGLS